MKTTGWEPHVWENCAWHYAIKRPFMTLHITNDGQFFLLVGDNPNSTGGSSHWTGNDFDKDPNVAVAKALKRVKDYFDRTVKLRESIEKEIGAL